MWTTRGGGWLTRYCRDRWKESGEGGNQVFRLTWLDNINKWVGRSWTELHRLSQDGNVRMEQHNIQGFSDPATQSRPYDWFSHGVNGKMKLCNASCIMHLVYSRSLRLNTRTNKPKNTLHPQTHTHIHSKHTHYIAHAHVHTKVISRNLKLGRYRQMFGGGVGYKHFQ